MSKNTTNETDTEIRCLKISPMFSFWECGPKKDSYYFQGDINMRHLVNDALEDGTLGFVAVTSISTYVGLSKNIDPWANSLLQEADVPIVPLIGGSAFIILAIPKERTLEAMKLVKKVVSQHKAEVRKLAQEIREVNNSNQPAVKVMTY